jgi:hypothetical protein
MTIPRDCKADTSWERLMEDGVEDGVALGSVMSKNERNEMKRQRWEGSWATIQNFISEFM